MKKYDLLIVGCGLTGATIAALNPDKRILILERDTIGGLHASDIVDDILVFYRGLHPIHTNKQYIIEFLSKYTDLSAYRHKVMSKVDYDYLSFPINLYTVQRLYGIDDIEEFKGMLMDNDARTIAEKYSILLGDDLYDKFYKGYTEKFWGIPATAVPSKVADHIPINTSFNDTYFNDIYQYIPSHGYTPMIQNMTSHCDIVDDDYFNNIDLYSKAANKIIYTGSIDEFYGYALGVLQWRTSEFNIVRELSEYAYPAPQINLPDEYVDYDDNKEVNNVRGYDYKHLIPSSNEHTIVSHESVMPWSNESQPRMYALPFIEQEILHKDYLHRYNNDGVIFAGRQADYKNYSTSEIIERAIQINNKVNNDIS